METLDLKERLHGKTGSAFLIEMLKLKFGGKGGGSPAFSTYVLPDGVTLDECYQFLEKVIGACSP